MIPENGPISGDGLSRMYHGGFWSYAVHINIWEWCRG